MKNEEFFESNPATFDTIFSKELHLDYNGVRTGRWEFGGKSRCLDGFVKTWVSYDFSKLEHIVLDSMARVFREQHMKNWSLPEVDQYLARERQKHFDPDPVKDVARSRRNI